MFLTFFYVVVYNYKLFKLFTIVLFGGIVC